MRKIISVILVCCVALAAMPFGAVASEWIDVIVLNQTDEGNRHATVRFSDQRPVIIDGRTLVPIRDVFEQLNYNIDWNADTQQVTLTSDNNIIIVTIDSETFTTNDVTHTLDVPAQIINDRTMLPIRALLESVGYHVVWEENITSRTIIIRVDYRPLSVQRLQFAGYSYSQIQDILEQEVIRIVNEIRVEYGLPVLTFHPELAEIARYRAQESTDYGYITGHISHLTGLAHTAHARAMGLTDVWVAGENWHGGRQTPQAVVDSWMNSPGHYEFIISGHSTSRHSHHLPYIGVGVAFQEENGGSFNFNWTLWLMRPDSPW